MILLPFMVLFRLDPMTKCPRCMRSHIIVRLPLTIVLSNLVSPVVVVWWVAVFIRTFFRPF
ncbi:hypothetical protein [Fimbriiglobus ruber]|nr:hypothetical protein [Fimbriiglobus ruber]